MNDLIIRSLQGKTTADEERRLRRWRQASEENEREYREVARLWELTGLADPTPRQRRVASIERMLDVGAGPSPSAGARVRRRLIGIAGAATAAAAIIILGFVLAPLDDGAGGADFGVRELATESGEMVTARLADGSIVRLAPNSRLRVRSGADRREVHLDGQAFFAVAEREDAPFVVRTRTGDAHVLGTRFGVRAGVDEMRVVVVEGRVTLEAGGNAVELNRDEMSLAREGDEPSVVRVDDAHAMLDWMGQSLIFQATPLEQVAREIERTYGVPVELADDALGQRTVTAWFGDQSFEDVVTIVCRVVRARCRIREDAASIAP